MQIIQAIGHFGGGGAERLAHNLALALANRGVTSTCLSLRSAGNYLEATKHIRVLELGVSNRLASKVRGMVRWRRFLRDEKPDLIHVHGPQSLVFIMLGLQGLAYKPKVWFTWHRPDVVLDARGLNRKSLIWALKKCDRVFGASQSIVDRLQAVINHPCCSVFVNAVPNIASSSHVEDTTPTLIWAARLVPPKDPQILIRAAAALRDEGLKYKLILAGSGYPHLKWFEEQTRELIAELKLTDRVEMPGWVSDTPALYQSAAIGVQTSHTEGLSMTLLEQMMAGLAIVATDVGDTSVAIENDLTGLLIPQQDEGALKDALRRLITDTSLRRRLGQTARTQAVERFTLDAMADRVLRELGSQDSTRVGVA